MGVIHAYLKEKVSDLAYKPLESIFQLRRKIIMEVAGAAPIQELSPWRVASLGILMWDVRPLIPETEATGRHRAHKL